MKFSKKINVIYESYKEICYPEGVRKPKTREMMLQLPKGHSREAKEAHV
jgi:hypothetical protein